MSEEREMVCKPPRRMLNTHVHEMDVEYQDKTVAEWWCFIQVVFGSCVELPDYRRHL